MRDSIAELKQARLKRFLQQLSTDPALANAEEPAIFTSLSELLKESGYPPFDEPFDLAELTKRLFKKMGLAAGPDEMMEHVLNGGTVEGFFAAKE
jgi:hypothetical protein